MAHDGTNLHCYGWEVASPRAVIHIVHGMDEHATRYNEFAQFLNLQHYTVYATDHRGHGKTAESLSKLGYIGEDGFTHMVEDEQLLCQMIKQRHSNLPYFLIGHSLGSFLAQRFLQLMSEGITGAVLIASFGRNQLLSVGEALATFFEKISQDKPIALFERVLFVGMSKKQPKAWLATDPKAIEAYQNDPFCGTVFPPSFYRQITHFLKLVTQSENIALIPASFPLLLLSGHDDPIGLQGKGMNDLYQQYVQSGHTAIRKKLYEHSKHEILHDVEKEQVFADIKAWLAVHIDDAS